MPDFNHCWLKLFSLLQLQQQSFYGPLSGSTQVSRYQKRYLPTHTYLTRAVLGKTLLLGDWSLIIWEATTAKRNYYRTNYILKKNLGAWARFGGLCPLPLIYNRHCYLGHSCCCRLISRNIYRFDLAAYCRFVFLQVGQYSLSRSQR